MNPLSRDAPAATTTFSSFLDLAVYSLLALLLHEEEQTLAPDKEKVTSPA